MVPNGWTLKHLSELSNKISDGIHSTPKYVESSDIYFVNGNNLKNGSIVITDSTKKVCVDDAEKHRRELNEKTILMSINGTIGNLAYYNGENVVLGKSACYINVADGTDTDYLYYTLEDSKTQAFYTSELTGSTIKNLSLKTIKATRILTPPLPEQRKIAKILSTWDKAISTTERLIDNSKQQKKALMQQLLTGAHTQRKRLLDDSGKPFDGEWEEVKLGDVCSKVTDGAHHSPKSVEGGYPMFSVKDMRATGFAENTARHISQDDFKALVKQNCKPEINDILIAKDGSILKYCFVVQEDIQGVILSSIALLRPQLNKISPYFIAQYFSQESVRFFVGKALTSGSGVPRIILKDFKGIHLRIPSLFEQQRIAKVLANADQEIESLEQQLADLKQEKKALMQQLLTGKRRVKI